ncbi:hypothetical protein D3C83_78590 [compost metagenome]
MPRGTPPQVIRQLENAIRLTVSSPEFVSQSEKLNVRPAFLPAEEFSALVAKEDAELSRLMQQIGLKK